MEEGLELSAGCSKSLRSSRVFEPLLLSHLERSCPGRLAPGRRGPARRQLLRGQRGPSMPSLATDGVLLRSSRVETAV